ncbi:MAG: DNA mismatch repair protein MutS [FCB group bacterium]|nr:DNA mismatch repair protein MutS [FCB group bacterium]
MSNTPMMKQYAAIKANNKGAVLFFRMGDFFEMFYEDAKTANRVLGLTLTSRNHGAKDKVPLAGFPHHQLESYVSRMVKAGHKVAICEQVEDPKLAKGIVKREVIEVVTAGSSLSENVLQADQNNYLASAVIDKDIMGVAYTDISTGEFFAGEGAIDEMREELRILAPAEIILPLNEVEDSKTIIGNGSQAAESQIDDWYFSGAYTEETLKNHFGVISLRGIGFDQRPAAARAAGAILAYLKEELKRDCSQIRRLRLISQRKGMNLDPATVRNLELFNSFSGRKDATLIHVIDRTSTAMGARMLRRWLSRPLVEAEDIKKRLNAVKTGVDHREFRKHARNKLRQLCDIERTLARLTGGRGNPRDAGGLKQSLEEIPGIKEILLEVEDGPIFEIGGSLNPASELLERLQKALVDDPPLTVTEGGIFRQGYNERIDFLREISGSGKQWIINRQEEERERTGITTLKIGYNKVFGYYIEVTKANVDKVPEEYIRKQTLVNAERYITPELKEYEEQVLKADDEIKEIEYELFNELRYTIAGFAEILQTNAWLIAQLDVYLGFAEAAVEYGYCMPEVDDDDLIELTDSRHPVVERLLPVGDSFVANDLKIGDELRLMIITGPNMAGKSTYLRQAALITLMAQCGSFVPAKKARIGVVDRIFTRVGAQDNLVEGESTFLLEMNEAANILNHATPKSLIVLDEIGRGTSTYDGLSIAWAITEYLHDTPELRSKTLFATHYHELTELEKRLPGVKNFNILVREHKKKIVFLRKIIPGGCDRSYGIQVARMAGLPESLIDRALEVLGSLEGAGLNRHARRIIPERDQLSLFETPKTDRLREKLKDIEPDNLSPRQALEVLYVLKKLDDR